MYALICLVMVTVCSVFSLQAALSFPPIRLAVTAALRMHVQPRFVSSSVATAEYEGLGGDKRWRRECVSKNLEDVQATCAKLMAYDGKINLSHMETKFHYADTFPLLEAFNALKRLDSDIDNVLRMSIKCEFVVDHNDLTTKREAVQYAMYALKLDKRWSRQYRENLECRVLEAKYASLAKNKI